MNIDQKIDLLNEELSTLIISRINGFHSNKLSRVKFLNELIVLPNEDTKYDHATLITAANALAEFNDYLSGNEIYLELRGFKLLEEDMAFEYYILVFLSQLNDDLEITYRTNDVAAYFDELNREYLSDYPHLLDEVILEVQAEITFGSLKRH